MKSLEYHVASVNMIIDYPHIFTMAYSLIKADWRLEYKLSHSMASVVLKMAFERQDKMIGCRKYFSYVIDIDGLVQEKRISIANVLELRLSWSIPSIR